MSLGRRAEKPLVEVRVVANGDLNGLLSVACLVTLLQSPSLLEKLHQLSQSAGTKQVALESSLETTGNSQCPHHLPTTASGNSNYFCFCTDLQIRIASP